jgi:hypothetical protein
VAKVSLMTKRLKRRCVSRWDKSKKRLLCYGFRRTGKAMGQVYPCWWRLCREINVLSKFEYHMFYVLYPFVTYLLALSPTSSTVILTWLKGKVNLSLCLTN